MATAGKLCFVALVVGLWAARALPLRAPIAAGGDLVFGLHFLYWLVTSRTGRGEALARAAPGGLGHTQR